MPTIALTKDRSGVHSGFERTSSTPAFPRVYFNPLWTPCWARISVFAGIEKLHGGVTVRLHKSNRMLIVNRIATLRRAKFDLGVRSAKDGVKGIWYWSLPAAGEEQPPMKGAR